MGGNNVRSPKDGSKDRAIGHANGAEQAILAHLPLPNVLEAMPGAVSIYDHNGNIVLANSAARKLFGDGDPTLMHAPVDHRLARLSPRDTQGASVSLEDWPVSRLLRGETISSDQPVDQFFTNSSGDVLLVRISGAPILAPDGQIIGAICSVTDITEEWRRERQQTEMAQREQEARAASERAARELERLQMTLDVALMRYSLDDLLQELLKRARSAIKSDTATLLLTDESGNALLARASIGPDNELLSPIRIPFGRGFAGRIAATRKPYAVMDTSQVEVTRGYLRERLKSVVGVPLIDGDRLLGVLHVGSVRQREFSPSDIWLLQQIADRATLAIDRAQLYDALQRAHAQSSAQARLQDALIEALTEGVILYSPTGSTLLANSAYRRMLGVSADGQQLENDFALRGKTVVPRNLAGEILPREQWPAVRLMRGEVIDSQHSQDIWLRGYDGREALYAATGSPVTNEQGANIGAVMVLRDVTAHRQLELEAKAHSAELEAIFETMVDGLLVHAPDGSITRVNNSSRQLLGIPPDILIDAAEPLDITRYLTLYDSQGHPLPADQWPMSHVLRGESLAGAQASPLRARTTDGQERLLDFAGAPMRGSDGEILGAVLVARDMTDLRALERRTQTALEALLDMAQAAVTVVGANGQAHSFGQVSKRLIELTREVLGCQRVSITARNPDTGALHALAVTGLKPHEEKMWWNEQIAAERQGQRLEDIPAPVFAQELLRGQIVQIDMSQPPYNTMPNPYSIQTMLVTPMMMSQQLVGFIALDYDGTSHEFTEDELRLASAVSTLCTLVIERDHMLHEQAAADAQVLALEQANHRMNEFLSIAAHELRTPITVIKANLQMVRRRSAQANPAGASSGRNDELLIRTERSLTRLTRLVDDLLDVSRVRAGKLEMRIEPVDLGDVLTDTVEEQRLATNDRVIELDASARGHALVMADPERIGQVITNYLTNALKYSNAKAPVRVWLEVDGQNARVSVEDQGPGISPAEQEQVWELFHRSANIEVLSGSGVGLGLGLHLCKTIVERHGGEVGLKSELGKGSTFWFTLPLRTTTEA
ncbi:MAG TPA: GAF domain-containing protein [Ktedonobacterales bacterium]